MKKTLLISAFPGTGKTYSYENSNKIILDSDSSKFDKNDFPNNYINHIKENLDVYIQKSTQIIADSKIDHSAYAMVDKVINDDPEYKGYQEGKIARRFLGGLFFERPKGFIKGFFGY